MQYANRLGYSDVEPYEVVRQVSAKCLEIRPMNAELDPAFKPEFVVGGFAGVCVNQQQQKWVISPDLEAPVIRIRQRKNGDFRSPCGGLFVLADQPVKFYDYNF